MNKIEKKIIYDGLDNLTNNQKKEIFNYFLEKKEVNVVFDRKIKNEKLFDFKNKILRCDLKNKTDKLNCFINFFDCNLVFDYSFISLKFIIYEKLKELNIQLITYLSDYLFLNEHTLKPISMLSKLFKFLNNSLKKMVINTCFLNNINYLPSSLKKLKLENIKISLTLNNLPHIQEIEICEIRNSRFTKKNKVKFPYNLKKIHLQDLLLKYYKIKKLISDEIYIEHIKDSYENMYCKHKVKYVCDKLKIHYEAKIHKDSKIKSLHRYF